MFGSKCIYHIENSMMDQVINKATGTNIIEKKSSLKLRENFIVWIVIQYQFEIIVSWVDWINIIVGGMLAMKE